MKWNVFQSSSYLCACKHVILLLFTFTYCSIKVDIMQHVCRQAINLIGSSIYVPFPLLIVQIPSEVLCHAATQFYKFSLWSSGSFIIVSVKKPLLSISISSVWQISNTNGAQLCSYFICAAIKSEFLHSEDALCSKTIQLLQCSLSGDPASGSGRLQLCQYRQKHYFDSWHFNWMVVLSPVLRIWNTIMNWI